MIAELNILLYRDRDGRLVARATREDGGVVRYVQTVDKEGRFEGMEPMEDMRDALACAAFLLVDDVEASEVVS